MFSGESASTILRALLAGSVLGFVEAALVFGTGIAPPGDAIGILAFDLLIGLATGALLLGLRTGPRQRDAALLLGPAVLHGLRGHMAPALSGAATEWLSRLAPVALAGALVLWSTRRGRQGLGPAAFFVAALVSQGLAGVALAVRAVDFAEARTLALPELAWARIPALILAGGLVACALAAQRARLPPLRADGLLLVASSCAAVMVGALDGARPDLRAPRAAASPASPADPDVLLVVMDTVRRDHLSLHGYARPTTPRLDAFAREATVFDEAYSNAPYTLASHASLFTGKLPSLHGAHFIPAAAPQPSGAPSHFALPAAEETLAERLRRRGYATGAVAANFALVAEWTGLLQGFEAFSCGPKRFWGYVPLAGSLSELLGPARLELLPFRSTWGAERVSAAARAWLAVPTPQPKFLFLNYIDAHGHRRLPPPPFDGQFVATGNDRREQSIARYDGRIRFLDEQLGELLAWLRAEGKLDRMLVVVTSDHGEFFGEHGHWDHGQAVYEEVLRVPLIVKLPHQREGRRVAGRVSLMQLPALVDAVLAGRAGPEVRLPDAPVVAEHWVGRGEANPDGVAVTRASYWDRFKLLERLGLPDLLFDLRADPREQADLFQADPALALAQRVELARATAVPLSSLLARRGTAVGSDPGAVERLRSLGYIQ